MFAQLGNTKAAAVGLVKAHVDLAKAELADIMDELKRLAVVIGLAIGLGLFVGLLIPIGTTLFLGEWLFGSMGWGIVHGTLLSIALVVAAFAAYLGLPRSAILGTFLGAVVVGVLVAIVFGLNLSNELWRRIGDSAFTALAPDTRPLVIGVGIMAAIVGVLGFIAGLRSGIGTAIALLFVGAIFGALLGAFSAITFGRQVGAALGVAVALLLWPILIAVVLSRRGVDFDAIYARLWPDVTIETTKETIEWVRERTPLGPKS